MRAFWDLSLGRKIIAITAMASILALLVTGFVTLIYEATTFRPAIERSMRADVEILRPTLTAGLSFLDQRAVGEDLASFGANRDFLAAAVYDRSGLLFATWRGSAEGEFVFPRGPPPAGVHYRAGGVELSTAIRDENQVIGHLFVARTLPPLYARLPQYGLMALGVVFALTLASAFLMVVLHRTISRPILDLSRVAAEVRDRRDYSMRANPSGSDEVGVLTSTFNEMLDAIERRESALQQAIAHREALQQELAQAQKMESIGRLAGGIAHDFNNYLTVIGGSIELALSKLPEESPLRELLLSGQTAAEQAAGLTGQLLAFARKQHIVPSVIELSSLVQDNRQMLRSLIKEDIELRVVTEPGLWTVRVDSSQMTQVLMNLATNARDAMPRGGVLTIELRNVDLSNPNPGVPGVEPGQYVRLTVSDTGAGMSDEAREHLFEPFYTTKERGAGTGLGLATSYGIVLQSGGHVQIDSELGAGTRVHVFLQRYRGPVTQRASLDPQTAVTRGNETVLVVEDNAAVRDNLVSILQAGGYRTLAADGGLEALLLAGSHGSEVDLLITDVVMPGMSGPAVADALRADYPQLKVLFVSGYAADEIQIEDVTRDGASFLSKPFKKDELLGGVRALLDQGRPGG